MHKLLLGNQPLTFERREETEQRTQDLPLEALFVCRITMALAHELLLYCRVRTYHHSFGSSLSVFVVAPLQVHGHSSLYWVD